MQLKISLKEWFQLFSHKSKKLSINFDLRCIKFMNIILEDMYTSVLLGYGIDYLATVGRWIKHFIGNTRDSLLFNH